MLFERLNHPQISFGSSPSKRTLIKEHCELLEIKNFFLQEQTFSKNNNKNYTKLLFTVSEGNCMLIFQYFDINKLLLSLQHPLETTF